MLDLPALQKLLEPLFPGLMGVRITEAAPDRVVARRSARPSRLVRTRPPVAVRSRRRSSG